MKQAWDQSLRLTAPRGATSSPVRSITVAIVSACRTPDQKGTRVQLKVISTLGVKSDEEDDNRPLGTVEKHCVVSEEDTDNGDASDAAACLENKNIAYLVDRHRAGQSAGRS
ncbi:hypothetical protein DL546_001785 [Coniochaeta pulveracea]|uniref:Uncharacterized protein n=1 Tax=Coniochaeta pulveracea TaxID=177199 RepID=A0A420XWN6_9PEZI|nr:hypothetical protein DL546_001785 [Coniochaeta pulveracea]